jgi:ATP-dependent protease Clp ATPase subunit
MFENKDIERAAQKCCDSIRQFGKVAAERLKMFADNMAELAAKKRYLFQRMNDFYIISQAPNKKIAHLALYGKKARTRKKNLNRIKKHMGVTKNGRK